MSITVGTNSYLTVAEADSYFEGRLYSDKWEAAKDPDKALIMAASLLDTQISWAGRPASDSQVMAWPRAGVRDVAPDVIPTAVKVAQAELALALLTQDLTAAPDTAGIASLEVAGAIKLQVNAADRPHLIPPLVSGILSPLGFPKAYRPTFQATR